MKRFSAVLAHAIVGACLVGAFAMGRAPEADPPAGIPGLHEAHPLNSMNNTDMNAAMAAFIKLGQPGPQHKFLADHLVGEWEVTSRIWMDPAAPPMEGTGSARFRAVFEGKFIEQEFTGSFMGHGFNGQGLIGYDNFAKQFNATWVDSMSTAMLNFNGSMSMDGSSLTFHGTMNEPMTGELGKTIRHQYKFESKDRFVFSGWEVAYGEPFQSIELTYTRKK